jgi:hypothetical protein
MDLLILKNIILHGQQNLPLRGQRDDGSLLNDTSDLIKNRLFPRPAAISNIWRKQKLLKLSVVTLPA